MNPPIDEEELLENIVNGKYQNIIILTGAGVSTAAGIPDFRSSGGLFATIRQKFGSRFPIVYGSPETVLSREFVNANPEFHDKEVQPILKHNIDSHISQAIPTDTHRFCAWLYQQGILKRVYTQNIDGLHTHPSLNIDHNLVVECHGSVKKGNLVLYGDDLPKRFYECCDVDFPQNFRLGENNDNSGVDLIMVFGTSLQVYPFCAVPNMVPKGCIRVLINRSMEDCFKNSYERKGQDQFGLAQRPQSIRIGQRKFVSTKNLWIKKEGNRRWWQLLVEEDCDKFVRKIFSLSSMKNKMI